MRTRRSLWAAVALLAFGLTTAPLAVLAQQQVDPDPQLQSEVQKALGKKQFSNVQVQVANGVVTLSGSVNKLVDKIDAGKKAEHFRPADVRNMIQVSNAGGPAVNDQELFQKLSKKLVYVRQGYWTHPFNAFTLQVRNGVVTAGGVAVLPQDKDEAIGEIVNTPGVRDLVDNIKVAPLSPNDDRIRRAVFNAVYGFAPLNRYALDPAKSIRIVVIDGHVTLVGSVDSAQDKQFAYMQANGVPGVFSVTNDLQVAGQQER